MFKPKEAFSGRGAPAQQAQRAALARRTSLLGVAAQLAALAAICSILLSPFCAALGVSAYYQTFGLIAPGVHARGTPLGGLTVAEAAARLDQAWETAQPIDVGYFTPTEVRSWQLSPSEIGIYVDSLATAELACAIGRGPGGFFQMISGFWQARETPLLLRLDQRAARAGLEALSAAANVAPQNAALRLEGARLVPVPAKPGLALDVEGALAALAADPYTVFLQGYLVLPMQPVAPRITNLSVILAQAERLFASSPQLMAYDPITDERFTWPISPEMLADWLVIQEGEAGPQLSFDAGKVAAFLTAQSRSLGPERWLDVEGESQRLAKELGQGEPLMVRVRHYATTYEVQPGDTLLRIGWNVGIPYWMLLEANPGLDENTLQAGQEIVIPSKDELLPLPVAPDKRIVISISEQRLRTYQNGRLRSEHTISTGIDRSPTQPGVFQVRTHELEAYASVWDLYMPHFLGIYEAWPGFMNGIHGLPTLSNGRRLWANILGRPASYGCIILDLQAAEDLYYWAEDGVVVEIRP